MADQPHPNLGRKPRPRQHNRLDRKLTRKLEDWILANWDEIKKTPMTVPELRRRATRQLEFSVSAGNITGCLRALDLEWPHNNRRSGRSYQEQSQAKEMEQFLKPKAVVVAECLIELIEKLGEPVPVELRRCADPQWSRKLRRELEDQELEDSTDE